MRRIPLSILLLSVLGLPLLSGCGGGSSEAASQPTSAVLTLSSSVTGTMPDETTINSYDLTVTLPAGVTVKASPDSVDPAILVTDPGVVIATSAASGSLVSAIYSAANGSLPGTVKIHVASAAGFDAGEFCKVTCDIAAGSYPTAWSFAPPTLDDATGFDTSTNSTVLGLEAELSVAAVAVIK